MKKALQITFMVCFLLILAVLVVVTATNLQETISTTENRSLAAKPEYSRESFLSGDYFAAWEDFFIDRAAGRNTAVKANTYAEMNLLKLPVVNGIYVSQDFLLPFAPEKYGKYSDVPQKAAEAAKKLGELSEYAKAQGADFIYVGIPSQLYYYRNEAPGFCRQVLRDAEEINTEFFSALERSGVNYLDVDAVYDNMGKPKDFYTVTDHHYSFKGALAAYSAIIDKINCLTDLNVQALTAEHITEKTLPNPFSGSRNRELFGLYPCQDSQTVGIINEQIPFKRWDNGEETDRPMLILPETEEESVTYSVYMGGDYGETVVSTDRPQLPKILVYGDSFTNALETLLYASFDEMRTLDMRHYSDKSLRDYIADYKPNVIICVRDCSVYLELEGNGQT